MPDDDELVTPAPPDEIARQTPDEDPNQGALFPPALIAATYQAPIPHPAMLRDYNDVSEGLGTRIADEWLLTVRATRENSTREVDHQEREVELHVEESVALREQAKRGQLIAFYLAAACVVSAIILLFLGHLGAAGIILGAPLLFLVGQFLPGKKS